MFGPVKVTLNVYSSRPNPEWLLRKEQAEEFESRVNSLEACNFHETPPVFGYRGFWVSWKSESGVEEEVHVFRGLVERGGEACFKDQDRLLERWLLETVGDSIPSDVMDLVRSEMDV